MLTFRWKGCAGAVACAAAAFVAPAATFAAEVEVGGKPLQIDVTNTTILNHHFDNKNSTPNVFTTRDDDNYNEWINRLNVQLSYWRFSMAARLDSYVASRLSDDDIKKLVALDVPATDPSGALNLTNGYLRDLNTRYLTTVYPSKLWITYQQPSVEATVGDLYVQLGRGLVFSVRKIDELSIDTTVRGGKLALDREIGPVHVDMLAFAGQMNPLRIDETSGRRLNVTGDDPLFFGFPTAPPALSTTQLTKPVGGTAYHLSEVPRANYLEDTVYGGRIELGPKQAHLGVNGAIVRRKSYDLDNLKCLADHGDQTTVGALVTDGLCAQQFPSFAQVDPTLLHETIRTFSGSINVPSIAGHGDLYVEVAGQQLRDGKITALANGATPQQQTPDMSGYAVYVAASARGGPVTASFEGKHYRSFFPIAANVDTDPLGGLGHSAPEFNNVFYSQPPTAQSIYTEPVAGAAPNICITGGRGLVTYRFTPQMSVFAWVGRFVSFTEVAPSNYGCDSRDPVNGETNHTDTWDNAVGTELFFERRKSKFNAYVGAIDQSLDEPRDGGTTTFYREGYLRYDIVKHIAGPFSIQAQGWHRRRYEPSSIDAQSWSEGENYTALQWSPHVSAIFGFEYLLKHGCQPGEITGPGEVGVAKDACYFFNGGAQWRASGSYGVVGNILDTVNVFVGERRGALRCVSGVCRQFPPFSGAKLEIVSRF